MAVNQSLGAVQLVTTDDVLVEVLNFFAEYGEYMRHTAAQAVRSILHNANVETFSVERDDFLFGLTLYEDRLDKGYSLTDCSSMNAMRTRHTRCHRSFDPRQTLRTSRIHHLIVIVIGKRRFPITNGLSPIGLSPNGINRNDCTSLSPTKKGRPCRRVKPSLPRRSINSK